MIIINRTKSKIVNLGAVNEIFKGADGVSIKANFSNGQGTQIERYNSSDAADVALEMLCSAIGKQELFIMPNDEQIQAQVIHNRSVGTSYHNNYQGNKSKTHGGS